MTAEVYVPISYAPPATGVHRPPEGDPQPPRKRPPVVRDLDALVHPFRVRLEAVLERLERQGYAPRVWETIRTAERGDWLKARGKSKNGRLSMHSYGAAADVICRAHRWDCHAHGCDFFEALGRAVHREGLYWGGDWRTFRDKPHVQAVAVRDQNRVRRGEPIDPLMRRLAA